MDFSDIIRDDKVHIKFMFYEVRSPDEVFDIKKVEIIGDYEVTISREISSNIMSSCLDVCNNHLAEFIKQKNIKHFIPYTRWTFFKKDGVIEICYYFARELYRKIYESDMIYVMMPTGRLYDNICSLFDYYEIEGWYDLRANIASSN